MNDEDEILKLQELHAAVAMAAPIDGVGLDKRIHFRPEATQAQKDAAQAVADAFDTTAPPAVKLRAATFRADASRQDMLTRLRTATPAQIDSYIDANVATLAQARTFLKALAKVIALDARS